MISSPASSDRFTLLCSLRSALAWNGPLVTLLGVALAVIAGLLLIRLTPLGGVLFVLLAVGGIATLIEPLTGLALALFLGPLWAYLRAEMPQIPAQIAQPFVALALAMWLGRGLARREVRLLRSPLLVPMLAFTGAALLSLWDAVELPVYGIPELIKWLQILLLSLFVGDYLSEKTGRARSPARTDVGAIPLWSPVLSKPRRLIGLLIALLVTGIFQASVGLWQFGLRGEGPDHFAIASALGGDFYRAYGTFEQPNPYAGYLGLTASLAVGVVAGILVEWYTGRLVDRCTGLPTHQPTNLPISQPTSLPALLILALFGSVVMLAALGASWSRGGWLGFGAAFAVMAFALPRKVQWGALLVAMLVFGGISLYATGMLPGSVTARLTDFVQDMRAGQLSPLRDMRGVPINDANYAVVERLAHWQAALEIFRYNLWAGVGLGCYEPAYSNFALINWPIALGHAHNYYLNLVAETGLIGLAAYVILWGVVFWQTWRLTRRADGLQRGIAIGLLGAWTQLSVHHLLDNLYVNNVHLHIGVLLGILQSSFDVVGRPTLHRSTN